MENQDTVYLLKECDSGTKMAVSAIDQVMNKVNNTDLKNLLKETRSHHEKLGDDLHSLLIQHHSAEKNPSPMAKSMAAIKTNVKMGFDGSDRTIADLITDGCNMGVKSLHKYLHQYKAADHSAKDICHRLIDIEEQLGTKLQDYL
ncbi:MAG: hypothetical protein NC254_14495 [bacterium]|nr:hypothetical protein [Clostridium sp.]MCM1539593.1 hypothetical protein [bacterium]